MVVAWPWYGARGLGNADGIGCRKLAASGRAIRAAKRGTKGRMASVVALRRAADTEPSPDPSPLNPGEKSSNRQNSFCGPASAPETGQTGLPRRRMRTVSSPLPPSSHSPSLPASLAPPPSLPYKVDTSRPFTSHSHSLPAFLAMSFPFFRRGVLNRVLFSLSGSSLSRFLSRTGCRTSKSAAGSGAHGPRPHSAAAAASSARANFSPNIESV